MSTNFVVREDLFQEYLNTIPCKVFEIRTSRMVQPDLMSSVTYPRFWRYHSISRRRCRISRGRRHISFRGCCYLLLEMHPHPRLCTSNLIGQFLCTSNLISRFYRPLNLIGQFLCTSNLIGRFYRPLNLIGRFY
jgi:hypothetical protein